ncbi:ANTAR domain-containing protein [Streptomyces sp. NPDC101116]|uniref:ANTAR domain-containing protein n=1 Tax=Streptomyces sp. NPDC101116 TaxID=3366107 RepID=UPI0038274011
MSSETSDTLDQAMVRSSGLDPMLRDLTDRAVQEVPGADACSITVRRAGRLLTLAGSDGMLAVPVAVEGEKGAALNFYGVRARALDPGRDAARAFAARAGDAIDVALRIERRRQSAADVRTALLSRSVIDQAIGILMARERIDARIALERLRRASQDRNVKLRDLCGQLVARVAAPDSRRGK